MNSKLFYHCTGRSNVDEGAALDNIDQIPSHTCLLAVAVDGMTSFGVTLTADTRSLILYIRLTADTMNYYLILAVDGMTSFV